MAVQAPRAGQGAARQAVSCMSSLSSPRARRPLIGWKIANRSSVVLVLLRLLVPILPIPVSSEADRCAREGERERGTRLT